MRSKRTRGRQSAEWRRPVAGLPLREAAWRVFRAVTVHGRPLDDALSGFDGGDRLSPPDRAFARLIVMTALRRQGQIDNCIDSATERPPTGAARDLLRLGVAQMLFVGTPDHAAVSTTVALAEAVGQPRFKALVNAVMRRLAVEGPELVAEQDAARLNMPDWLWNNCRDWFGVETTRAIAEAHLADPPLDLTPRNAATATALAPSLAAEILPTGSLRRTEGGPVGALPGFAEGAWWVQDAAAALPVQLLGPVDGMRVIDLCAAPGGKTLQLAAAGAEVTAVDQSEERLTKLADNLSRTGLSATVVTADAVDWRPDTPADAVLIDAPCTATGTIRRHPDIARLKRPRDGMAMVPIQKRLLAAASQMVRPGGRIVFCTCSLDPAEGTDLVARYLAEEPTLERDPIRADELAALPEALVGDGDVRTLPCHWNDRGGIDGFQVSRLRRTG